MKEILRQRALELGFDACRVTTANAPESASRFTHWLAAHRHGEMAVLAQPMAQVVEDKAGQEKAAGSLILLGFAR